MAPVEAAPPPFTVREGTGPLVVSIPHAGTYLPPGLRARLSAAAAETSDADHHVGRLYDFLSGSGAGVIAANWSRWYVDLNRPPDDSSLYPGQATTGLCPLETFGGEPVYAAGAQPGEAEVAARVAACWRPYHEGLGALLARTRERCGRARLLDAHSIVSVCPRLFEGRLPDINLGTNDGRSCTPGLRAEITAILAGQDRFSWVVDGRFKGGFITRHYGRPEEGVEAVQIELAQCGYMDEDAPAEWSDVRAADLRALLRRITDVLGVDG